MDGHGGTEHRQTLVQTNDFLFVQPQQRPIQQSFGFADSICEDHALQVHVRFHLLQKNAEGGLGKKINAAAP